MKTKSTSAQAAAMIRKELKALLPGTNFSVTSGGYSKVNVRCLDLPPFIVKKIKTILAKYEYGHFDGMTDCYEVSNSNPDLPQVKFVFLNNSSSTEMDSAIIRFLSTRYSGFEGLTLENLHNFDYVKNHNCYASQMVSRLFHLEDSPFWEDILDRAKAA